MPAQLKADKNARLLQAMAEELKLPLLQIARQAELLQATPDKALLGSIETAASRAMWFVDSFLLSHQLSQQQSLILEPVTVSAALNDSAHMLDKLAKQYDSEIEVRLSGKYGPVMAHQEALRTAIVGLATTLITADSGEDCKRYVLAAHKSRGGVVTGVFCHNNTLSQSVFRQGKALYGQARQPLRNVTAHAGAGVFIADSLFTSMESRLRVARHHKLTGLAATLHPSYQLALV